MATFQVPQFIDQKPKIVGPLTLSQFFYLAAAGAISFVCFYAFNLFFWVVITLIVGAIGIGFAFIKVNGQDMATIVRAGIGFALRPRIYTWQRTFPEASFSTENVDKIENLRKNMSIQDKLRSIALSVTTGKSLLGGGGGVEAARKRGGYEVARFETGEKRMVHRVDFTE